MQPFAAEVVDAAVPKPPNAGGADVVAGAPNPPKAGATAAVVVAAAPNARGAAAFEGGAPENVFYGISRKKEKMVMLQNKRDKALMQRRLTKTKSRGCSCTLNGSRGRGPKTEGHPAEAEAYFCKTKVLEGLGQVALD